LRLQRNGAYSRLGVGSENDKESLRTIATYLIIILIALKRIYT